MADAKPPSPEDLKLLAIATLKVANDHGIVPTSMSAEDAAMIIVESLAEVLRRRGLAEPIAKAGTHGMEVA